MKKIMFNDRYGLTQAVLDGRKTMTRRIVPQQILKKVEEFQDEYYNGALATISDRDAILSIGTHEYRRRFPQVGEVVAIAQSYNDCLYDAHTECEINGKDAMLYETAGWKNKMFVKPDLMPHHIRITNVRVERLQDISDSDCLREGLKEVAEGFVVGDMVFHNPKHAFEALIDKISKIGTWDSNPYVFVYEFELVD